MSDKSERRYKHYRTGDIYTLLNDNVYFAGGHNGGVAEHRDNRYVTYSNPDTGQCFLRLYHEFFGSVYVKELNTHVQRFTRVVEEVPLPHTPPKYDPKCTSCAGTGRYFDASHFASMACTCHMKGP